MQTHEIVAFIFGSILGFLALNNLEQLRDIRRDIDFSIQMSEKRAHGYACTYHENTELVTHFIMSR